MNIALLISGYLRSFEHNIENIKKYIIENNKVDIYIYITKNKETKYMNLDIDINKIREYFSLVKAYSFIKGIDSKKIHKIIFNEVRLSLQIKLKIK